MKVIDRFDPGTEWDERKGDGNWNRDANRRVLGVAMHKTGFERDTVDGVVRWFQNRRSRVSAHYVVGKDGAVYRVIPEEFVAYATGGTPANLAVWWAPDGRLYEGYGVNLRTIAVEAVGASGSPYSPAQLSAVKELVVDVCRRYRLGEDAVFAHREVQRGKIDGAEHIEELRAAVSGLWGEGWGPAEDSGCIELQGVSIRVPEFVRLFRTRGGVHTFGYPLAGEQEVEGRTVQFFERYVMELAPEVEGEWRVRGWLLGSEEARRRGLVN